MKINYQKAQHYLQRLQQLYKPENFNLPLNYWKHQKLTRRYHRQNVISYHSWRWTSFPSLASMVAAQAIMRDKEAGCSVYDAKLYQINTQPSVCVDGMRHFVHELGSQQESVHQCSVAVYVVLHLPKVEHILVYALCVILASSEPMDQKI